MKKYRVAVVGVGAVGKEILKILRQRNFPSSSISLIGRTDREQEFDGEKYTVTSIEKTDWKGFQIALFAGTEGEKGAAKLYGKKAIEGGAVVIDNGDDFRMDNEVPLVIPEINSEDLRHHKGLIANPNCSTIQMAVALWPLHQQFTLREVVVSTYQAVSGSGTGGMEELKNQITSHVEGKELHHSTYPHPIFSNVIPQVSTLSEDFPGYYKEEVKMIRETRKIFHTPHLPLSATCVRVPVMNCHSEAITARFEKEISLQKAREILSKAPGVVVNDEPEKSIYPMPLGCSGEDAVYVGRLRPSSLGKDSLEMWVVSDNVRKGAALNAIQIAEKMIEMGLI